MLVGDNTCSQPTKNIYKYPITIHRFYSNLSTRSMWYTWNSLASFCSLLPSHLCIWNIERRDWQTFELDSRSNKAKSFWSYFFERVELTLPVLWVFFWLDRRTTVTNRLGRVSPELILLAQKNTRFIYQLTTHVARSHSWSNNIISENVIPHQFTERNYSLIATLPCTTRVVSRETSWHTNTKQTEI